MKNIENQGSRLLDAMRRVTAPGSDARGLPSAVYQDDQWFEIERDHVMGSSWAAIAYGSELPASGYAKPVELMGIPLLVVRDNHDEFRVFHNVCSHRGMKLVPDKTRVRTVLRCPYHSWSYDFDGRLIGTPHIGGANQHYCEGFDKGEHSLKSVRFAVWMDIIFVNLSGDAPTFADYIAPLEARWSRFIGNLDRHCFGPGESGSNLDINVRCNWKLAVENYCESYHLPWVHPKLNSYSPLNQHFNITDGDGMSGQGTHVYELASIAGTRLPLIDGWPADKLQYAEYISLYPNTLLGLQADHLFSVIVLPRDSGTSVERLQISYFGNAQHEEDFATCRDAVLRSWDIVFHEDIFAVEGMQAGRRSPSFDGGVLTPVQDVPTKHFHCWIANRYCVGMAGT